MRQPLVTVVTPSYNQGHFIRATIESVLSQDYPHIEYIIMDGGSTDETAAVTAEYAGRLTFISEKDRGQSHAINKGFRMANGQIVSWLNSDDTILPGAISHAVAAFQRNPSLGAVYGEGYLIDYAGDVKSRFPATEPFNLWKLVYLSDYILQQTVYFRRAIFADIGWIDESLNWGMDWDILIRIAQRYPMQYIPEYMGCLREYGDAKTFSGGGRRFSELAAIMRRHGNLRYPPGFFTYGLDTYSKIACDLIQNLTPAFLQQPSQRLQNLVIYLAHRWIAAILRDSQGLYADGWAGPTLRYMLPAGSGAIRISGTLPEISGDLRDQRLSVSVEGKLLRSESPGFGAFQIEIPYTAPEGPLHIQINASKFVVPSKMKLGADPRKISYRIDRISWA